MTTCTMHRCAACRLETMENAGVCRGCGQVFADLQPSADATFASTPGLSAQGQTLEGASGFPATHRGPLPPGSSSAHPPGPP